MRVLAASAALVCGLVSGCNGGGSSHTAAAGGDPSRAGLASTTRTSAVSLSVSPASGARGVRPDARVKVTATGGTLSNVTVTGAAGKQMAGGMNLPSTVWTARTALALNSTYTVSATGVDSHGLTKTVKTTFHTVDVADDKRLRASSIAPLDGSTVGVAQPVSITFNHPVRDRAAVQRALSVVSTPAVEGAWYWIDEQTVDYRPREFWPAGTKVSVRANLAGVNAGRGYWGSASRAISFKIGRQQILKVDLDKLRLSVVRNGKVVKKFRVTSGKPGWETRNGIKVILDKETDKTWTNDAINAPEDYTLHSNWALRMTQSGEFFHDAPWSIGNIGNVSASHGCVGMYPSDAHWLFDHTIVGDAVVVTGSPRPYKTLWNQFADWNVKWPTWAAGNASQHD